jgi:hypothetical protein
MLRHCVSLLTTFGFLALQLASMPHVHGPILSESQRDHDEYHHFHFAWLGHYGEDHEHSDHKHSHHEDESDESDSPSQKPVDESSDQFPFGEDHDHDAVYITASVAALSIFESVRWEVKAEYTQIAFVPISINVYGTELPPSPRWHPPDKVLDSSDCYLTLRNLRI